MIDFKELQNIFDVENTHIGYLTLTEINKVMNFPIKEKANDLNAYSLIDFNELTKTNGICLIIVINRFFNGEINIQELKNYPSKEIFYINKKLSAVMAGLGQYGKNQLFYDNLFGFDSSIFTFFIFDSVKNLSVRIPPKYEYMDKCQNCNDCINHCPVHAIHGNEPFPWLDEKSCRNFSYYGDNPIIPSIKYGIANFCNPTIPKGLIKNIKTKTDLEKVFNIQYNGEYSFIKNNIKYFLFCDNCRECLNQPKCGNSNYVYKPIGEYTILQEEPIN